MGAAIEMGQLNGYCRFILMTATLSDNAIGELHKGFLIPVSLICRLKKFNIESQKPTPTVRKWRFEEELRKNIRWPAKQLVITNTVAELRKFIKNYLNYAVSLQGKPSSLIAFPLFPDDRANIERDLIFRLESK